jgi:phosphoribosyl-ATP pyrophosphohydrolase
MLHQLYEIIEDRKQNPKPGSYTNSLFDRGREKASQKVGEEAIELIIAAEAEGKTRIVEEAADLVYHLFVLLVHEGISLEEVETELEKRHAE